MKISEYTDGAFGTESVADFLDRIASLLRDGTLGVSEVGVKSYNSMGEASVSFRLSLIDGEDT